MTLGPQGIEWEITQVGITTGKSSLPLCLGRGRTHRETDRKSHTHSRKQGHARHTARPSGSGGELSAQKAPVKTGRRRHTRNSSKWRRFYSPAGTVGERGAGRGGLGSCAFPWCNAWLVVSRRRGWGGVSCRLCPRDRVQAGQARAGPVGTLGKRLVRRSGFHQS